MRLPRLAGRTALLVTGSLISSICYAATIRARLGLGPLYVMQDGIARHAHVTIGHAVMIVGVLLFAVALVLRWRPGVATLALPFLGGTFLDAVLPHIATIHGLWLRLLVVVIATVCMAFGGALMVRAAIGINAYDGIMLAIHDRTGRPVAPIRLGMEATVLAVGAVLGGAIGVGTVITGLLIGPALHFWLRVVNARPSTTVEHTPIEAAIATA